MRGVRNKIRNALLVARTKNRINSELVSLFPSLRKQGLKVAIFSNATNDLRGRLQKLNVLEMIDDAVISGEIGYQKPHKEAFAVLFERLGASAQEVVFIDDSPKSLEKAEEIGYTPILFQNNEQLISDLRSLGIEVN